MVRLLQIVRVLLPEYRALRGFGGRSPDTGAPARLARRLAGLGPAFVKLGQVLSTRSDVMPPAYVDALSRLQDNAPQVPVATVLAMIEAQLGHPVNELFATFDPVPAAAASLAQVHKATLPDGAAVAVKVRRPDVERLVLRDLDALGSAVNWLGRLTPGRMRRTGLREFFQEFRRYTILELDFSREGRTIDRMRANFVGRSDVKFPEVHWDRTSQGVLTLGWVEGLSLGQAAASLDPVTKQRLVTLLIDVLLQMFVSDGLFHADLHPGNIFFHPDGTFTLIDFGMYGELTPGQRDRFVLYWAAVVQRQTRRAFHHFKAQTKALAGADEARFFMCFAALAETFQTSRLSEMSFARVYLEMMRAGFADGFVFPSELMLHAKALTTAEALIFKLAPDARFEQVSRPFIARAFVERAGSFELLKRRASQLLPELLLLGEMPPPEALDETWDMAASAEITTSVRNAFKTLAQQALDDGKIWKALVKPHAEAVLEATPLAGSVNDILALAWHRYDQLEPSIPEQPTLGAAFTTRASALILAMHEILLRRGVAVTESYRLVHDIAWRIYREMGELPMLVASAFTRDPARRLRLATDMFRRFPFGAPGYGWRDVPAPGGTVAFDCVKCPVAEFLGSHDASELCVQTMCRLDFPLAEAWGGRLERTGTIALGAAICDFRWSVPATTP